MSARRGGLFVLSALALFWTCRDAWSGVPGAGQPLATEAGVAGGGGGGGGPRLDRAYGQLPLYFVENRGQVRGPVDYYVLGQDTGVSFTSRGVNFALTSGEGAPGAPRRAREASLRSGPTPGSADSRVGARRWTVALDFVGANRDVEPAGEDRTPAVVSYFKGPRAEWKSRLPTYARVVYRDLWPGIDLTCEGTAGRLKYTFVVRPGADPRRIRLAYRGAESVRLNGEGQIEVMTPVGGFRDDRPYAYQEGDAGRVEVRASYAEKGDGGTRGYGFGFRVGPYDHRKPLVIDPVVLVYCGYIGGSFNDYGRGIAVDGAGSAYVTGYTESTEATFPVTVGPDLTYNSPHDVFVAKVNAAGTGLVYCGYIGGSDDEYASGIAVDGAGSAYVTGATYSTQATFPVTVGPDLTYSGRGDGFVAKVNASGTALVYCGYIGGSGDDWSSGIAVDSAGSAYVTGLTGSSEATFPVTVGPDLTLNGFYDAFVAKVNAAGTGFVYCGYIGGSDGDYGRGIAVDGAGSAYVTGYTESTEATFPVTVGPDLTSNGTTDAFVAKVNPAGTGLVYCGYIGGSDVDEGRGIAVDGAGSAHVTGRTNSTEATFPVTVGPDLTFNGGGDDVFVAKVNAAGTGLVYCGYIGGSGTDWWGGIAVDGAGSACVTGFTYSDEATFPVTVGPDLTFNGNFDAFVAKVNAAGTGLVYCGYVGGAEADDGYAIAVDGAGSAYVTGSTTSTEATFPVTVGPDLTFNGFGFDAFVAKVSGAPGCAVAAAPIAALLAVKPPLALDNIEMQWQPDPVASGYNIWYVGRKQDIPLARQASQPPAVPVTGCAVPNPASGATCTDLAAVSRGAPASFFYQVRAYCDPLTEGP